jgi:predicted alpha/beta hydrolase family esterase
MTLPPIVIVPDLRDGARAWQRVANLARHFASDVVAVEPVGDTLAADVGRVRDALAAAAEPPVVLAHGYGALLATLATTSRNASALIFVAGYMLDYGETIFDAIGGPANAISRTPADAVGWRTLPTTYVVCAGDRSISATVQRRLALTRATTIVELEAGDQPFRTHAEALVQILHEDLVAVRGGELHAALALVRSA